MIMGRKKKLAAAIVGIMAAFLLVQLAADQIRLENARRAIERTINADLPPGTDLDSAMAYLDANRYYPEYRAKSNVIDAVRGYDVPSYPARVGRWIHVIGYLNSQQTITHWEIIADRYFLPLP
jgi:hypothetical protein